MTGNQTKKKPWWENAVVIIPIIITLIAGAFTFGNYVNRTACDKENVNLVNTNSTLEREIEKLENQLKKEKDKKFDCEIINNEMEKYDQSLQLAIEQLYNLRLKQKNESVESLIISTEIDSVLAEQNMWVLNQLKLKANCQ